ncbi:hypothetical protein DERF_002674 [Dermatophagoides farinae]|uniref:Endonuclease/exonuclease/phosphatase domain-containing protein n=1 Tax=Dermatophagoides farinae TaxID=6954 RepID=A0A922LAU7_DERFA|nr:hypothetical protein DERF_002674 [Dermatophagoides farinae]
MGPTRKPTAKKIIKVSEKASPITENIRVSTASPVMSKQTIEIMEDDSNEQPMTNIDFTQPSTSRHIVTQPITTSHNIATTSHMNVNVMPQRHTSRHNIITSNVNTSTNAQYTSNTVPPSTIYMPTQSQTQYTSQQYTQPQQQIPHHTQTYGTSSFDYRYLQSTVLSRPPTPVQLSSSHTHMPLSTQQPLTTTITRTNPLNSNLQQPVITEDIHYITDALGMAMDLKGNISTEKKFQTITALKIAINLHTENQALKEQLSTNAKRKRHIYDEEKESILGDDEDSLDSIAEMKMCILDLKHSVKNLTEIIMGQKNNNVTNTKVNKPVSFADIVKENKSASTPRHQTVISVIDNTDTTITRKVLSDLIQPAKHGIDMTGAQASVYSEPNGNINNTINCVINTTNYANNNKCIIAGDFNAKSIYWGEPTSDERGHEIMLTIVQCNLHILNEGNRPTFDTVRGQRRLTSCIDLTLVNNNLIDQINNWHIHDEIHLSDHRPITFTITDQCIDHQQNQSTTKWNTTNINWTEWSSDIEYQLHDHNLSATTINNINDTNELDLAVTIITVSIQFACNLHCGKYRHKRIRPAKWTSNQSLLDITKKQKAIYRKIRRCHNPFTIERLKNEYMIARQQYRDVSQSLKNDDFNKYLNGQGPENCYQKVCRMLKNSDVMVARTIEGTNSPIESTTKLVNSLFPDDDFDDSNEQHEIRQFTEKWLEKNKNNTGATAVSLLELNNVIHKFRDGKAPGLDGISPRILKNLWLSFPDLLLALYNACLRLKYVPYLWKSSIIRILPKPGRDDYSKTNAYRPIGLISVLGKVLERIMSIRITNHLISNGHMSDYQYGFIAGKSTDHALLNLHNDLESAITRFKHELLTIRGIHLSSIN